MNEYICESCGEQLSDDDAYWYEGDAFCENCFYDSYTYCERCDEPISRDYCYIDRDGYHYCNRCHEDNIDDNAPVNPEVNDSERKQIINLSKCWLRGEKPKTLIRINRNDYHLEEIQEKVGLTTRQLYLYGLADRDEYQIKASSNILETVRLQISELEIEATISEDIGCNRLAFSRTLREEHREEIIQLIKTICPSSSKADYAGHASVEEKICAE